MDPQTARRVLEEGCVLLDMLGVTYWLSAGTALGAYRDKLSDEFLLKDTDIDVGVLGDSRKADIESVFNNHGFGSFRSYKTNKYWSQLTLIRENIIFDIYFFIPSGDLLVNYNEHGRMEKPSRLVERMELVLGHPVPTPIEDYLKTRFGPSWKVPKPKVDWQEGCANLIKS
jgi:hypothetical protein